MQGIKLEFAKCRARLSRWREEELLIAEEMRRTIVYLRWKAQKWKDLGKDARQMVAVTPNKGMEAYALRQAHLFSALALEFSETWTPLLVDRGMAGGWEEPTISEVSDGTRMPGILANRPLLRSSSGGSGLLDPFQDDSSEDCESHSDLEEPNGYSEGDYFDGF